MKNENIPDVDHPNLIDRNNAINFARSFLSAKDKFLILDTETTGLGEKDVIIQIAVIDLDGNTLLNTLVKPKNRKSIPRDATAIHGIRFKDLLDAPHFIDVLHDLTSLLSPDKSLLVYNLAYDTRLINQTIEIDEINYNFSVKGYCIMQLYAQYTGQWNPISNEYRFKKLPNSNHTAQGDCLATLELIKYIAKQELSVIPENYKPTAIKPDNRSNCMSIVFVTILFIVVAVWLFLC